MGGFLARSEQCTGRKCGAGKDMRRLNNFQFPEIPPHQTASGLAKTPVAGMTGRKVPCSGKSHGFLTHCFKQLCWFEATLRNDGAWSAVAMLLMGWLLIVSVVNTMDSCLPTPSNRKRFGEDPSRRNDGA